MLPPLDLCTSRDNPEFAILHKHLTNLLGVDGAVRLSAEESTKQAAVEEEYQEAYTVAVQSQLLRSIIPRVYGSTLPEELRFLITLISSPFDASQHARINHVLSLSNIDPSPLGALISKEISSLASSILKVADPLAKTPCTVDLISARKKELKATEEKVHHARLGLAVAISTISETQGETFELGIKALEGVKYGSAARSASAEAGYFATVAEGLDEKLKVIKLEALQSIYDPEVRAALEVYDEHLDEVRLRLKARERVAQHRLREYEEVGKGMSDIAERHAWLSQEMKNVKAQISSLEDGH